MDQLNLVALPVDSSPTCKTAFDLVRLLYDKVGGFSVTPIHIWSDWEPYTHDILFPFAPLGSDIVEFERELEEAAQKHINSWLALTATDKFVNKPLIYRGTCRKDLIHALGSSPYDLIAIGAYGASGPVSNYVGSVTHRVLQMSVTSVLVARPQPSKPKVKHITVAVDLTPKSYLLLEDAARLAAYFGATFDILYVFPDPSAREHNDIVASVYDISGRDIVGEAKAKLNPFFDAMVRMTEVPYPQKEALNAAVRDARVLLGDPAQAIVRYAQQAGTDLIVVGKYDPAHVKGGQIGRTARELLFTATCHLYFRCNFVVINN